MDRTRQQELESAYRLTTYVAGSLRLRIGEPHPALDALLREHGLHTYAYLTAWNPASIPRSRDENETAQRALLERLAGRVVLHGASEADDASWPPEPSVLVLGLSRDDALALAREFGQSAIVVGQRGRAPELAWVADAHERFVNGR